MTLQELEAFGAYHNAGFIDIYHEGRHKRLATVDADGTLHLLDEGRKFVEALVAKAVVGVLAGDEGAPAAVDAALATTPPAVTRKRAQKAAAVDSLDDLLPE